MLLFLRDRKIQVRRQNNPMLLEQRLRRGIAGAGNKIRLRRRGLALRLQVQEQMLRAPQGARPDHRARGPRPVPARPATRAGQTR